MQTNPTGDRPWDIIDSATIEQLQFCAHCPKIQLVGVVLSSPWNVLQSVQVTLSRFEDVLNSVLDGKTERVNNGRALEPQLQRSWLLVEPRCCRRKTRSGEALY